MSGIYPCILFTTPKPTRGGTTHIKPQIGGAKAETVQAGVVGNIQTQNLGVLSVLGKTFEVTFGNGQKTRAVLLTYSGIKKIGIDINAVLRSYGEKEVFDAKVNVNKYGLIVGLNLYQQLALLRAIGEKISALKDKLGFYTLKGMAAFDREISKRDTQDSRGFWRAYLHEKYGVSRFWTGEKVEVALAQRYAIIPEQLVEGREVKEEDVLTDKEFGILKGNNYFSYDYMTGSADQHDPSENGSYIPVLFAAKY